jgi:transcriptional regulator with XRE-family HTH domain
MPPRRKKAKPNSVVSRFASLLRETRLRQAMTQFDLATKAGISVAYVGRLEAGTAACTIDVAERLAKALAVSIADLFPQTPPPDMTAQLRERVRLLAAKLVDSADRETLALVAQFLARLT